MIAQAPAQGIPAAVNQEVLDVMQDPVATYVVMKWVLEGKTKLLPRGHPPCVG